MQMQKNWDIWIKYFLFALLKPASDKVMEEQRNKELNEVITELMTTDVNKYTDQSPYLNGIMSEALAQNNMNTSLNAYTAYLSETGFDNKRSQHAKDPQSDSVFVDIVIKDKNSHFSSNTSSSRETLEQQNTKKRVVNGVPVLPTNETLKKKQPESDSENETHAHLDHIMKEIIISNNDAMISNINTNTNNKVAEYSKVNSKVAEVLPVIVENSSNSSKIMRQAAFEEVSTSSSSKTTYNAGSYHFSQSSTGTNNQTQAWVSQKSDSNDKL